MVLFNPNNNQMRKYYVLLSSEKKNSRGQMLDPSLYSLTELKLMSVLQSPYTLIPQEDLQGWQEENETQTRLSQKSTSHQNVLAAIGTTLVG